MHQAQQGFTWLLDSWGTQPGSQLFPVLLRPALEWHLTDLDARRPHSFDFKGTRNHQHITSNSAGSFL